MRTQRGITLVALIITIVVLLILAVVSIGAITQTNLINQAQESAATYNNEKAVENNTLDATSNIIDQVKVNIAEIK